MSEEWTFDPRRLPTAAEAAAAAAAAAASHCDARSPAITFGDRWVPNATVAPAPLSHPAVPRESTSIAMAPAVACLAALPSKQVRSVFRVGYFTRKSLNWPEHMLIRGCTQAL